MVSVCGTSGWRNIDSGGLSLRMGLRRLRGGSFSGCSNDRRVTILEEQIRLYRAMFYGRKSEKSPEAEKNQLGLFNEAEETVFVSSLEEKPEEITVPSHTRKKSGRRPLPDDLPREEVIHDLAENEKSCACGSSLSRIGAEVSEKLDIVPARVRLIKHVRYKYAYKSCEGV